MDYHLIMYVFIGPTSSRSPIPGRCGVAAKRAARGLDGGYGVRRGAIHDVKRGWE